MNTGVCEKEMREKKEARSKLCDVWSCAVCVCVHARVCVGNTGTRRVRKGNDVRQSSGQIRIVKQREPCLVFSTLFHEPVAKSENNTDKSHRPSDSGHIFTIGGRRRRPQLQNWHCVCVCVCVPRWTNFAELWVGAGHIATVHA